MHDILLIDDSVSDRMLIKQAFDLTCADVRLHNAEDGEQGLAALEECPAIRLVLLDLNMPGMDGLEFLESLAPETRACTAVLVLSSSQLPDDIHDAYQAGVNAYIPKPLDFDGYVQIAQGVQQCWLQTARLPPPERCVAR